MTFLRARPAVAALAAILLGTSVMSGCASNVPTVPEDSTPSATTSETPMLPTPTPTPEVTTTNDPHDPDTWIVTEQGIGPVEVADDYDESLAEIRATGVGPIDCDGVAYGPADDNAYDIMVIKDRHDGTDEVVEITVTWLGDTMGVGPRTEEDLGLGSTKPQVLGAYERAEESTSSIEGRSYVSITDDDSGTQLVFTYVDGYDGAVSVSVISGAEPAYEPCA